MDGGESVTARKAVRTTRAPQNHPPAIQLEIGRKYWLGKSLGSGALRDEYLISAGLLMKYAAAYRKQFPKATP